jgi:hypothetical protein
MHVTRGTYVILQLLFAARWIYTAAFKEIIKEILSINENASFKRPAFYFN